MESWLAIVVGFMYAAGFFMLLRRSLMKVIIGLSIFTHGANLLLFTAGNVTRVGDGVQLPIVPHGAAALTGAYADPLPQALVLTAIVISFGIQAFALVLVRRAYQAVGSDDLDRMTSTDTEEGALLHELPRRRGSVRGFLPWRRTRAA
ncbi:Na(+)/H(+) antiporter subunit C [Planctomycetes bacterium Pla163]|uniref:Na(+)/H(+) antiporter subunit C n=1 Tax=Rohdeia mirabilis TaxID=2528008 RepID=A0A518CW29_9BACT|nr:Na(+)/H(+) antiporter subunit C [Planctomycetes bacterium Pla163]